MEPIKELTFTKGETFAPIIRAFEKISGRGYACKTYATARKMGQNNDEPFWSNVLESMKITLQISYGPSQSNIVPSSGGLIVVANHPFGIPDGLALAKIVSNHRMDLKTLAKDVMCRIPELSEYCLPIDQSLESTQATKTNIRTISASHKHLNSGGALLIFPAGALAKTKTLSGAFKGEKAIDSHWHPTLGTLAKKTGATILPVFFEGQNSRAFQIAANLGNTIVTAACMRELHNKHGMTIRAHVGEAFKPDTTLSREEITLEARKRTLTLEKYAPYIH